MWCYGRAVGVVFVFVVYATVAFCIAALSVWYEGEFRIVMCEYVGLMRRRGWCVVVDVGGIGVWRLHWY